MDYVLRVVGAPGSVERFEAEWRQLARSADSLDAFNALLPLFVQRIADLPRTHDPESCPRVVVTGDFFTRFSPFFIEGVRDVYTAHGIT